MVKKLLILLGRPLFLLLVALTGLIEKGLSFLKRLVPRAKKITRRVKKRLTIKKLNRVLHREFKLRRKRRGRPPKRKLFAKETLLALILIIIGIFLILAGLMINFFKTLPSPNQLIQRQPSLTTKIYDRSGILLYKIYREENRTLVPLEKIPQELIKATLAIEDKEFYSHDGISLRGVLRAAKHNLLNPDKPKIGGSTITQQLVKNTLLSPEKTWQRKIKEAVLALLVEARFSKDEILQMYLNEVPYGGTAYGAEEASQKYFGKHVWEINQAEAAMLAGLTRAPTKYSPFGAYPENAKKRQIQVIKEMEKSGYLDEEEASELIRAPLRLAKQKEPIKAPHFVFYIKDLLVENFGRRMVEEGGLEVTTTLDWSYQQIAEGVVRKEIDRLSSLRVSNGAALVVDPKTGAVLAMVGSKDYFDFDNDGNVNVVLRPRQPGSAIKPINYSVALDLGYTAATIIPDTPITFQLPNQPPYSPRNYDGQFHGNISLRTALASSFNVPAVKVLASYGIGRMIEMGQKMGITTWDDPSRFGLSLTLGGGEVKLIDLAQAYSVLANLGEKIAINPIREIKNSQGEVIYQNPCLTQSCSSPQVLDPGIAFILNDILADNRARAMAFGPNSLLKIEGRKVAVKTGTTNNLRDNWCLGYTPSLLTAVWVGNNDNSPMSRIASGITGATPIWHEIMEKLLEDQPLEDWPLPDNVVKTAVCRTTGTLPCPYCPEIGEEYFLKGTVPEKHCRFKEEPSATPEQ